MSEPIARDVNTTPQETQTAVAKKILTKSKKAVEKNVATLEKLEVKWAPPSKFKPNEYNPNRQSEHEFELLISSIREDGFTMPIVVNFYPGHEWEIVDGEHRWRAAQVVGLTEIPYVEVHMSDAQMKVSTIRHNTARGSHDLELEVEVLRDLQKLGALDWAKDSLLMSDDEINRLLQDVPAPEALAGETYSEAWVPDTFNAQEAELIRTGTNDEMKKEHIRADGTESVEAWTPKVVELQQQREKLIAQAKTEQDRVIARRETQIYRVSLMYSGDEASIVREALGDKPAQKLLEMCQALLGGGA